MIILEIFVLILLIIGVVVVVRSGEREIELDKQDRELPIPSQEFQMLPTIKPDTPKTVGESWTLDSVEDTAHDHEGE